MPYTERTFRVLRLAFVILCCLAAASVGIGAYIVTNQHDQITQQAKEIQIQRFDSALRNCRDQNQRHDHTLHAIRQEIKQLPPTQRVRAQKNIKDTIRIIDALAPRRNCIHFARLVITEPPVTPPLVKPLPPPVTTAG